MSEIWLYHLDEYGSLLCGDAKKILENDTIFPDESIDMAITSPPYWALRRYLKNTVKLRDSLTEEEKIFVFGELEKLGIKPQHA